MYTNTHTDSGGVAVFIVVYVPVIYEASLQIVLK